MADDARDGPSGEPEAAAPGLVDRLVTRHRWLRAVVRVQQRFDAIEGNGLASSITLSGFTALFALTLLAVAVIGFVSAADVDVANYIVSSLGLTGRAARMVTDAVDRAQESRRVATVLGIAGLLIVGTSFAGSIARAYDAAWRVTGRSFLHARLVGLGWLAGMGLLIAAGIASTTLVATVPIETKPPLVLASVALNTAAWLWTTWTLPNRHVAIREVVWPAVVGGVAIEVLKVVGGFVVPRMVSGSSALWGAIGVVFALLAWLFFFGRVAVYVPVLEVLHWERTHGTTTVSVRAPVLPHGNPAGPRLPGG